MLEQYPDQVSIQFRNEVYFRHIEAMNRIAAIDALVDEWRKSIQKRITRLDKGI